MRSRLALLVLLALPLALAAGEPAALLKATADTGAYDTLKALTTEIGPRLAGSPADHRAHAWAAARLRALGLQVRTEEVPLARTWIRGVSKATLGTTPLRLAQHAWSPSTRGPLAAPLALVPARNAFSLQGLDLKGRIVLAGEPTRDLDPPMMAPPLRLGPAAPESHGFPLTQALPALQKAGVRAVLLDAGKTGDALNMDGSPLPDQALDLPVAFVAHGDYLRLAAAAEKGESLDLELGGTFGPAGHTLNTVAELRGSERPAEAVLLGAHLDSWDLGTGATDNGAGVAAVMEAARLLTTLGAKPRRTVRFVLFGGEEQGYLGSAAYAKAHGEELPKLSAVFVMDTGAGAVDAVALQGRTAVLPVLTPLLEPLKALGVVDTDLRNEGGTDHIPFHRAGVPAFCLEQRQHSYARDHHAETDTLDKVDPGELQQCAVVLAWLGWQVADLPGMLPR